MLILFDIDDTLVDHTAAAHAGARALRASIGSPLSSKAFLASWLRALEHHFDRYLAGELSFQEQRRARVREVVDRTLTDAAADELFATYQAAYEAGWSLFPDVIRCLERLSSVHAIGVISNGDARQQRSKLANTGLSNRLVCTVISEECGFTKPSKEIFLRACEMAGEPPPNAIYVGDRYDVDAQGARAAGLRGVWLDRRARVTPEHVPPVIHTLDELDLLQFAQDPYFTEQP